LRPCACSASDCAMISRFWNGKADNVKGEHARRPVAESCGGAIGALAGYSSHGNHPAPVGPVRRPFAPNASSIPHAVTMAKESCGLSSF
jgi:hypothetical protein